jgi:DNA recombination protein RmuC
MILNIVAIGLSAVLLLVVIVFLFTLRGRLAELKRGQTDSQALSLMQQQIGQLNQNMAQQLQSINSQFQKTTGDIHQTLGVVKEDMGRMETATQEVLSKAKNIAQLEELLRAPKFRGGMSELFLADLLAQVLPPAHFSLQHKFKSGERVDAAVRIGSNLVPVDAKFPLENFRRFVQEEEARSRETLRKKFAADVKKHIDDIASKYILPDEGTYDFAMMYIPAENVYYETILKDENLGEEGSLLAHAMKKRVIPVSPNSFFAYLQVIVLGLKGLEIEKSAQALLRNLFQLQGDLARFKNEFQVLGTHLTNARSKYEDSEKRLDRFSDKLELMQGSATAVAPAGETESAPEKLPEGKSGTKTEAD